MSDIGYGDERVKKLLDEKDAEILRLRGALKEIQDAPGGGPAKRIATQALGDSK